MSNKNRGQSTNPRKKLKYFCIETGNTLNSHRDFIKQLPFKRRRLIETSVEECDAVLVFCPVISRAGTDILSALQTLDAHTESKPVVLVVLHHTFDQELTVPDSSRSVDRVNTLTVDCLFHEDRGLLQCYRNQNALEKVKYWIKREIKKKKKQEKDKKTNKGNKKKGEGFQSGEEVKGSLGEDTITDSTADGNTS